MTERKFKNNYVYSTDFILWTDKQAVGIIILTQPLNSHQEKAGQTMKLRTKDY